MNKRPGGFFGWLRHAPTAAAGEKVKALFQEVASDPRFHRVAGLSADEVRMLLRAVEAATFARSNIVQGGYAGRKPVEEGGGVIFGLSHGHQRRAPAAHELFHLARDVRQKMPVGWEPERCWDQFIGWKEECIVWTQTLQYAPMRGTIEFVMPFAVLGLVVFGVLKAWYWLLGL